MTLYILLFRSCTTQRALLQIHATLLVCGLHRDPLASTKLIESYAKMGSIETARLLFDRFSAPDSFMWGVMIKSYVQNLLFQEAIRLYHSMQHHQLELGRFVYPPVLGACSALRDVTMGRKVHGRIIKGRDEGNAAVQTSLLQMYGQCGCFEDARQVFDGIPTRDVILWSSMISGCIQCGKAAAGLAMLSQANAENIEPDCVIMMQAAQACADLGSVKQARSVHGHIVRRLDVIDEPLENSLITMYGECGCLDSAEKLFRNASCRSVVSWTAMISCYNQSYCYRKALGVFAQMQESDIEPNAVTMMGVLCSCSQLGCLREGRSVHGFIVRRGTDPDVISMGATLVNFYASFRRFASCFKVFEVIDDKTLALWNSLIAAYAQNGNEEEALRLFIRMRKEGLLPDSFTLASSLSAFGQIGNFVLGTQIHGHITKSGFQHNGFVQNSLIDMYCKCRSTETAYRIFCEIKGKDVVTWNSMIGGFSQNGYYEEAIELFNCMHYKGLEMDEVTFLSAIQACSHHGSLQKGKWIHHKLITSGLEKNAHINTALTTMYAKCGDIVTARRVFNGISEKNIVSWSSIISAYKTHGLADDTIILFSQMVASGIRPNEVTFLSILSACSHAGLVEEGIFYYNMMRQEFGIEPQMDHCTCMVDLLSRSGKIDLAFDLIQSMPIELDASIWRALLSGCNTHNRKGMVGEIHKKLL